MRTAFVSLVSETVSRGYRRGRPSRTAKAGARIITHIIILSVAFAVVVDITLPPPEIVWCIINFREIPVNKAEDIVLPYRLPRNSFILAIPSFICSIEQT